MMVVPQTRSKMQVPYWKWDTMTKQGALDSSGMLQHDQGGLLRSLSLQLFASLVALPAGMGRDWPSRASGKGAGIL
jgi:hypothetical protein